MGIIVSIPICPIRILETGLGGIIAVRYNTSSLLALVGLLAIGATAPEIGPQARAETPAHAPHIHLADSDMHRLGEFRLAVAEAHAIIAEFASTHGWSAAEQSISYDVIEVYPSQAALWYRMLELRGAVGAAASTPMPSPRLAAAFSPPRILAVTPEAFAAIAPEYAAQERSWPRLIAHELAHGLHAKLLDGETERYGPQWFREGFAGYAAGQNFDDGISFDTASQALIAARDNSPPDAYRRYIAAFRYFADRAALDDLIRRAGEPEFEDWLSELDEAGE